MSVCLTLWRMPWRNGCGVSLVGVLCVRHSGCSPYQTCSNTSLSRFHSSTTTKHGNRNPDSHYKHTNTYRGPVRCQFDGLDYNAHPNRGSYCCCVMTQHEPCWKAMVVHALHACPAFIQSPLQHCGLGQMSLQNGNSESWTWRPQMTSTEEVKWGLDTPLSWFDSAADTCNLRRAVVALPRRCFLWLWLKNSPSVTEYFQLMIHQMTEFWAQVWKMNPALRLWDWLSCCASMKRLRSP